MLKGYFQGLYQDTALQSTKYLFSLLEKNKKAFLLDCGCWDGTNTLKYAQSIGTRHVYGIEIDENLDIAKKKGIEVKKRDLNKVFPFKDEFFDVVVAYHVIEHLVNVRLFVSECNRVLKKNGYLLIGTPNLASWHNIFPLLAGMQPFSGPTIKPDYKSDFGFVNDMNKDRMDTVFSKESETLDHVKVMTTRALISLLEENKFRIEKFEGFGYYPFPPMASRYMSYADPYHSHYIVVKSRKQ